MNDSIKINNNIFNYIDMYNKSVDRYKYVLFTKIQLRYKLNRKFCFCWKLVIFFIPPD